MTVKPSLNPPLGLSLLSLMAVRVTVGAVVSTLPRLSWVALPVLPAESLKEASTVMDVSAPVNWPVLAV